MNRREATVRHVQEMTFIGKAGSNHWVTLDSSYGKSIPAAPSPMEMILIALGACTGGDVVSILKKKRVAVTRLELKITGERAEEHPQVYRKIHIDYVVEGPGLQRRDIDHAVELSRTKYCSVSAMLSKTATMTHSIILRHIHEQRNPSP